MLPALPVAAMDAEAAKARMSARMNRPVRVRLRDDRVLHGLLWCMDAQQNFCILDAVETRMVDGEPDKRILGIVTVARKHIAAMHAFQLPVEDKMANLRLA